MRRTLYLPLVGIIVGSITGLVFWGADAIFANKALAVILGLTVSMLITGAFLEEGSVAQVMGVLIRYQSLLLIPSRSVPFVLIAAHAFSRYAAGSLALAYRPPQEGKAATTRNLIIMAVLGMVPLLLVGSLLFLLLVPVLWAVRTLFGAWLAGKDGGFTNDRLVTTQHVVEIGFYLLVILAYRFTAGGPVI